ncbi:MAG: four helix bundle protein [Bacteroidales bacterium]
MATVKRFEDLETWKLSREICKDVFRLCQKPEISRDFSLQDQMKRSSGSIMDNIAEGFERGGNKEFMHFLYIAKGSSGELRSQLYRALDRNFLSQEEFEAIKERVLCESNSLGKLIVYLKTSEYKGHKHSHED